MFRRTLFWLHLAAGLVAGLAIAIMCFTGAVLAFEKELVAWAEGDARQIAAPPAGATRLAIERMQAKLREAQPEARPASVVFQNDPRAAVAFTSGRSGGFYMNPYTGEVRQPQSRAMAGFMHTMTDLHRVLGFHGEQSRPIGKLINGACNLAFLVLAVSGLYLWMPRTWTWRALRPVIWFRQNATAKARDFNWHNAIGLWTAPVLIVLTLTAVPISFRWGGELINRLAGAPAAAAGPRGAPPAIDVPAPGTGAAPLPADALLAAAQQHAPDWKTITLRLVDNAAAPSRRPGDATARPQTASGDKASNIQAPASLPAATFTIRHAASWPRTATTTLSLSPFTGEVVRRTGYSELAIAQRIRSWTRFLHTGEALGFWGQLVAGLACLGGCVLVYTGFALSWRRFFNSAGGHRQPEAAASPRRAA